MIKHCHEEGPEATGVLMGLIKDYERSEKNEVVIEVTNCFPLPRESEEEEFDDAEYQSTMIRHLRNVNVDHLVVGNYQANPYGASVSKYDTVDYIRKQYQDQSLVDEAIVLLYDPIRGQKGFLNIKAVRLSPAAIKIYRENDPDAFKNSRISFDKFFEEIPVTVRNSHLIGGLMCELDDELKVDEGKQLLDMGSIQVMEKSLQNLMKCVEDVSKWANTQRQATFKQAQVAKENAIRLSRGDPPLTEDEVNKMLKLYNPVQRTEALLNSCQTRNFAQQASSFAAQNVGKLYLAKALQNKDSK